MFSPAFPPYDHHRPAHHDPPYDHHRPAHHDTSSEMTLRPQIPPRQDDFRNANSMQSNSTAPPMKSMSKMFYKTKMCLKFKSGACPYGNSCTFAHGVEDLREPPPGWKNIMSVQGEERNMSENSVDMQRILRLKICRNFYNGVRCPYGDRCTFLHHDPDRVLGGRPAYGVETNPVAVGMGTKMVNHLEQFGGLHEKGGLEAIQKPSLTKTKLCNTWEMSGECLYGDKCHYAHGISELQKYDGNDNEVENRHENLVPLIQPNKRQASSHQMEQQPLKQRRLHCKLPNKISLIYGDWIE